MKTFGFVKYIAAVLLLVGTLLGQNPTQPQPFSTTTLSFPLLNPPVAPAGLTIQQVGTVGSSANVYYYWVVAESAIGNSSPAGPIVGYNAISTLSVSNYFTISWRAASGATGYDVLRTTTSAPPSGACACAVVVNTGSLSANDQSNTLNAYTVATLAPASLTLALDNEAQPGGGSSLILRQNGTQIVNLSSVATFPAATRAGDLIYWNGTSWTNLSGNNSGTMNLQETSSGVPSWVAPNLSYYGQCSGPDAGASTTSITGFGLDPNVSAACNATVNPTTTVHVTTVSHACNLKNLAATASVAGFSASDGVVTVYVNGAASALTCTMGTGTSCTDVAHSAAVVAGNKLSVGIVTVASSVMANMSVGFDCM